MRLQELAEPLAVGMADYRAQSDRLGSAAEQTVVATRDDLVVRLRLLFRL